MSKRPVSLESIPPTQDGGTEIPPEIFLPGSDEPLSPKNANRTRILDWVWKYSTPLLCLRGVACSIPRTAWSRYFVRAGHTSIKYYKDENTREVRGEVQYEPTRDLARYWVCEDSQDVAFPFLILEYYELESKLPFYLILRPEAEEKKQQWIRYFASNDIAKAPKSLCTREDGMCPDVNVEVRFTDLACSFSDAHSFFLDPDSVFFEPLRKSPLLKTKSARSFSRTPSPPPPSEPPSPMASDSTFIAAEAGRRFKSLLEVPISPQGSRRATPRSLPGTVYATGETQTEGPTISELEAKVLEFSKMYEACKGEVAEGKRSSDALRTENKEQGAKVKDLSDTLRKNTEESSRQIGELQKKLEVSLLEAKKVPALETALRAAEKAAITVKDNTIANYESAMKTDKLQVSKLQDELKSVESALKKSTEESSRKIEELQKKLEVSLLEANKVPALETALRAAEKAATTAKDEAIANYESAMKTDKLQVSKLQNELKSVESALTKSTDENAMLKHTLKLQEAELRGLVSSRKEVVPDVHDWKYKHDTLLEKLNKAITESESQIAAAGAEVTQHKSLVEDYRTKNQMLSAERDSYLHRVSSLESSLKMEEQAVEKLKTELAKQETIADNWRKKYEIAEIEREANMKTRTENMAQEREGKLQLTIDRLQTALHRITSERNAADKYGRDAQAAADQSAQVARMATKDLAETKAQLSVLQLKEEKHAAELIAMRQNIAKITAEDPTVVALYQRIEGLQKTVDDLTAENKVLIYKRAKEKEKVAPMDVAAPNAAQQVEIVRTVDQTVLQDLRDILPQCTTTHEAIADLTSLHEELKAKCETIEARQQDALKSLAKLTCATSMEDRVAWAVEVREKIKEITELDNAKENIIEKVLKVGLEASHYTKSLFSTCTDLQAICTDEGILAVATQLYHAGDDIVKLQEHVTKVLDGGVTQAIMNALDHNDLRGALDVETVAALRMRFTQDRIDRVRWFESWNPLCEGIREKVREVCPMLEDAIDFVDNIVQKNQPKEAEPQSESEKSLVQTMRDEINLAHTQRLKAEKDAEDALKSENVLQSEIQWLRTHIENPDILQKEMDRLLQRKKELHDDVEVLENAFASADQSRATNNYGAFEYAVSNVIDHVHSRLVVGSLQPHRDTLAMEIEEGRSDFVKTGTIDPASPLHTVAAEIMDSMATHIQAMKDTIPLIGREITSVSSAISRAKNRQKKNKHQDSADAPSDSFEPRPVVRHNRLSRVPTEEKGVATEKPTSKTLEEELANARNRLDEERKKVTILQHTIMRGQGSGLTHSPAVIPSAGLSPERARAESPSKRLVATHTTTSAKTQETSPARVDALVQQYVSQGTIVPQNFRRVVRSDNDLGKLKPHNMFQFGTRKVQLVEVERCLAVIVGGGYLLFDEFCAKFTDCETRRLVVKQKQHGSDTSRTALVKSGRGFNLT